MNDANGNRLSASIVKTPASGGSATTTRTYSLTAGTNVLASIASTKTYQYAAAGAPSP
ncbi:hypothetical protein ACFIQG_06955 [Comamonas odontotermitis]|uniref:hypothetical protein n=1 Tax=Comamonas odontotermitis TaxID=379895 RepID=UPI00366DCD93